MKIKELVLFGKNKKQRILPFNTQGLSIIVGDRSTGKSSIGKIIDYCFGKDECHIPEGFIKSTVSAYGLWLSRGTDSFFVARAVPADGYKTSDYCYYQENCVSVPKDYESLTRTDHNGLNWFLSRKLGISENLYNSSEKSARNPIEASAKHCLAFCVCAQNEIASNVSLFHDQDNTFERLVTKDIFPYFLGAIEENNAMLVFELKNLEKEANKLENDISKYDAESDSRFERGKILANRTIETGMVPECDINNFTNSEITALLLKAKNWENDPRQTDDVGDEKLNEKLQKLSDLEKERVDITTSIAETERSLNAINGFSSEADHQASRLKSIGLFSSLDCSEGVCPFCSSPLTKDNQDLKDIRNSLKELDASLENISGYSPRVSNYHEALIKKKQEINSMIRQLRGEVDSFYQTHPNLVEKRKNTIQCAKLIGQIDDWLSGQSNGNDVDGKKSSLSLIQSRIDEINQKIKPEGISDKIFSISYSISTFLNDWSKELKMKYEGEYRLDFSHLTLVCNQKGVDIPLINMGSSSNYLDAHLISYIGLQKFLIKEKRPVPNFLFFDQPSQAFFAGDVKTDDSDDLDSVRKIYSFLAERVADLNGELQIIVVDHADFEDDFFQKCLVEKWNEGNGLIPLEWIEEIQASAKQGQD